MQLRHEYPQQDEPAVLTDRSKISVPLLYSSIGATTEMELV